MAARELLLPWDQQPQEIRSVKAGYAGGLVFAARAGSMGVPDAQRWFFATETALRLDGALSPSPDGLAWDTTAASITSTTTTGTGRPMVEIPAGDWTFQCVVHGIAGSGANPGFWRIDGTQSGNTFVIDNGNTRRPWVRVNGVDILKATTGPQWVAGQKLNLLVRFKNSTRVEVWWDGVLQHSATHSTAQQALISTAAIYALGSQSISERQGGKWTAVRFWSRYLGDQEMSELGQSEWAFYERPFTPLAARPKPRRKTFDFPVAWSEQPLDPASAEVHPDWKRILEHYWCLNGNGVPQFDKVGKTHLVGVESSADYSFGATAGGVGLQGNGVYTYPTTRATGLYATDTMQEFVGSTTPWAFGIFTQTGSGNTHETAVFRATASPASSGIAIDMFQSTKTFRCLVDGIAWTTSTDAVDSRITNGVPWFVGFFVAASGSARTLYVYSGPVGQAPTLIKTWTGTAGASVGNIGPPYIGGMSYAGAVDTFHGVIHAVGIGKTQITEDVFAAIATNPWCVFQPRSIPLPTALITTRREVSEMSIPWTEQPQGGIDIAWDKQITNKLIHAASGSIPFDGVNGTVFQRGWVSGPPYFTEALPAFMDGKHTVFSVGSTAASPPNGMPGCVPNSGKFTYLILAKFSSSGSYITQIIFGWNTAASNRGFGIGNYLSSGYFYAKVGSTSAYQSVGLNDDRWHLLGVSHDGSTMRLWKDGVQVASAAATTAFNFDTATEFFYLHTNATTAGYAQSAMSLIFDRELTDSEHVELAANPWCWLKDRSIPFSQPALTRSLEPLTPSDGKTPRLITA